MKRFKPRTLSTDYALRLLESDFVLTGLVAPFPKAFLKCQMNTLVVENIHQEATEGIDLSFFYKPSPTDEGSRWDHYLHVPTDACVFVLERPHVIHVLRVFPHQVLKKGAEPYFVNRLGIWLKFAQLKGYEESRLRYLY